MRFRHVPMPLAADDLAPLIAKLPHDELMRLVTLVLRAAAVSGDDDARYASIEVRADEFRQEDDGAAWEGEGWDAFSAPR